jgi:deoxyribodipyrimidine photolyase
MKNQKYLTDNIPKEKLPKQYSVMSPYISALKPLLTTASNSKDYNFNPSGMGRTRIGEALAKGENPQTYYNSSQTVASQALKRELLIREFFHQAKKDWDPRRPSSSWSDGARANAWFKQWKDGETGHLLIDAGMTQLAKQGFMPNRVRMLCASFLTKNLRFWWEDGEQYFAKNLVDYNEDSNIGNWQYISGAGFNSRLTDVLSPNIQLKKYDSNLSYCRSILGNQRVPVGLKALDLIREPSLYAIKPIVTYEESKAEYLKSLS